jgi:hypothetical protein
MKANKQGESNVSPWANRGFEGGMLYFFACFEYL